MLAALQLLEGRFCCERQLLYRFLGNKDRAIRNDTLSIQNPYRLRTNLTVCRGLGQADRPFRPEETNEQTGKYLALELYLYVDCRSAELRRPSYLM
jgi:hypothetical protein